MLAVKIYVVKNHLSDMEMLATSPAFCCEENSFDDLLWIREL